jgi:DNA-binding beta-propeller fold protein YncE/endonuclease YncB( thermonuclease family)
MLTASAINSQSHSAFARCPNGSHISPDKSHCEKVKSHKGLKRCPNGSHRSPDGSHCEKVSNKKSSSKHNSDDKNSSKSSNSKALTTRSKSNTSNDKGNDNGPILPKPTLKEGIEISGRITYVVDGDTLDINNVRIRLALVNTPEVGQEGYASAKSYVKDHCLNKNGQVDIDDGQREGSFGREIGVVYCDGMNLNEALMANNLAVILPEFCEVSEFSHEVWAESSCSPNSNNGDQNNSSGSSKSDIGDSNPYTQSDSKSYYTQSDSKSYVLVTKWGGFGNGQVEFNHPASIAADPNGQRFYISDLDNNRIQVIQSDGDSITGWGTLGAGKGQFDGPGAVAVDDEHKLVFVSDIKNNRIEKFDIQGKFLGQWGKLGRGDNQFDHPGDIALDPEEEKLYVTDIHNNRIQAFYYDGNFIDSWGEFGLASGQFNRPAGITMNTEDNLIYVSDTANNRIQVFDTEGKFVKKWGSLGLENGQFARPDGIFYEPSEKLVYVADRQNHRIQVFDDQGKFVAKWDVSDTTGNPVKPRDIVIDSSRRVYVVDKVKSEIDVFGTGPSIQKSQDKKTTTTTTTKTIKKSDTSSTDSASSYTLSMKFNDFDHANYKGKTTVTIKNSAAHEELGKKTFDFGKINDGSFNCCQGTMTFDRKDSKTDDKLIIDAVDLGKNGGTVSGYELKFDIQNHKYKLNISLDEFGCSDCG